MNSLPTPGRWRTLHAVGLAGALLGVTVVAACGSSGGSEAATKTEEKAPIGVETIPASLIEVPDFLELEGTLQPNRRAHLSPLVSGHVAEVKVERGDVVQTGAELVVLRKEERRLAANAAWSQVRAQQRSLGISKDAPFDVDKVPDVVASESDWVLAKDELTRTQALFDGKAVPAQALDQAKAREQAAKARLDAARNRAISGRESLNSMNANAAARADDVKNATLVAPFAGAIVSRTVEVGEFVSPQTPIVEIVDATTLRLQLDVPERMAASVHEGQVVTILVDGTNQKLTGKVRFVAAAIDADRRTLTVEVLADNPEKIRAGHFARARLALGTKQMGLLVPASAVQERAGVHRIYVVADGRATARVVEVVEQRDDGWLLRGDVHEGDVIVKTIVADLSDGAPVTAR